MIRVNLVLFLLFFVTASSRSQSDTTYLNWFSEQILANPLHPGNGITTFNGNTNRMYQDHLLSKITRNTIPVSLAEWENRKSFLLDTLRKVYRIDEYLSRNYNLNVTYYDTIIRPTYKIIKLTIESFPGVKVPCLLYVPDTLSQPAPAIVYANGAFVDPVAGQGHYGFYQWQEYSVSMVQKGYVVLGVSLLGYGLDYANGDNQQSPWGDLINFAGDDIRLRMWIAPYLQALKYLSGRSDVDTSRVGFTGSSNGGVISYHMAFLDPRIKSVVSVMGFPTNENFIDKGFTVPQYNGGILNVDEPATLLSLIAPKPHMLIADENDDFYNSANVQPLVSKAQPIYDLYGVPDKIILKVDNVGHDYNRTKRQWSFGWFDHWLKGDTTVNIDSGSVELVDSIFAWTPTETSVFNIFGFQSKTLKTIIDSIKISNAPQFVTPIESSQAIDELKSQLSQVITRLKVDTTNVNFTFTKLWEQSDTVATAEYFHLRTDSLLYFPVVSVGRHSLDSQKVVLFVFNTRFGRAQWRNKSRYRDYINGLIDNGYMVVSIDLLSCGELSVYDSYTATDGGELIEEHVFARYESQFGRSLHGTNTIVLRKLLHALKQRYSKVRKIQIISEGPTVSIPSAIVSAIDTSVALHVALTGFPSFKTILDNYTFGSYGQGVFSSGLYPLTDFPQLLTLSAPKPFAYYWFSKYDGNNASVAEAEEVKTWPTNIYQALNTKSKTFHVINPTYDESDVFTPLKNWLQVFDGINEAPIFDSLTNSIALEDSQFHSLLTYRDVDEDSIRFSKISGQDWLKVDSVSGQLFGIPHATDVGANHIDIQISDNNGGFATQSFNITVLHTNHDPVIISLSDTVGSEDSLFTSWIIADDVDSLLFGDQLYYELSIKPYWILIDSATGMLSGTPRLQNVGDTNITVKVKDNKGGEATRTFLIHIQHFNHAPEFVTVHLPAAAEDSLYVQTVYASDQDSGTYEDVLIYGFLSAPDWLSIDSVNGRVTGTPRAIDVGDTFITVQVKDGQGGEVSNTFLLQILHTNHAPLIHTIELPAAIEDHLYSQMIYASDQDSLWFGDRLTFRMSAKPGWLSMDSMSGHMSGVPNAPDVHDTVVIEVIVSDNLGSSVFRSFNLSVLHFNHTPTWVSEPDTIAKEDEFYFCTTYAADPDSAFYGDYVRYAIVESPGWLSIDSITGALIGTPLNNMEGDTILSVKAYDQSGAFSQKEWALRILPTNYPPSYVNTVYPTQNDTMTLFKIPIQRTFIWASAKDPDLKDTVKYAFKIKGLGLDTIITDIRDTSFVLSESIFAEQELYSWSVLVTDGEFFVINPDTFNFQTTKRVSNSTYNESPTTFFLFQNYPNPFNPRTTIRFQVPELSKVRIEIYNILGQQVQVVFNGKLDARYYEMEWNPRAEASGIYFAKMSAEGLITGKKLRTVKKMTYLK